MVLFSVSSLYTAERCYFDITQQLCTDPTNKAQDSAKKRDNVKGYDHV